MKLYSALAAAVRAQGVDLMFGVMGDANLSGSSQSGV
jgi:thiamine pyrophosphate-dependent acetolactate synthase large subunit-like protein